MPTYDAGDIIGQSLKARKDVPVYIGKPIADNAQPVGIIKAGNSVGVVDGYIQDNDGTVLWRFKKTLGSSMPSDTLGYYMVKHDANSFDLSNLQVQGVISLQEKLEAEKQANKSFIDKIGDIVGTVTKTAIIIGVIYGVSQVAGIIKKK